MAPPIQYARTDDGVSIAHYAIGEGTPALVYLTPGSHLEFEWEYPEQRAWLEALARNRKLVRLDHRGSGLSDREVEFVITPGPKVQVRNIRIEGNQFYDNAGNGVYLNTNGNHLFIRNSGRNNGGGNFTLDAATDYGQILTAPGAGFANSNPWANFSY